MQKLPVGSQDFFALRERNLLYVDKTKYVLDVIESSKYMFFARPRRMGKSMLCNTLKAVYQGRKDLFEGLYIQDKVDWQKIVCPVVHIDFSGVSMKEEPLSQGLTAYMHDLAQDLGVASKDLPSAQRIFDRILHTLANDGKKIVIIIDEYDRALNDFLDDKVVFNENREVLRGFYGIMKMHDHRLEKVFLTGVSKYGKVSVFSQLNNVTDYSFYEPFANMCGYTQEELEHYFAEHIEATLKAMDMSKEFFLKSVKAFYNGYSYNGENTLYNPYSILNLFQLQKFKNYWYDTGTPTFLIKALRTFNVRAFELEKIEAEDTDLDSADIDIHNPIALLFQTGYLTIKQVIRKKLRIKYRLGFPNIEVKQAFSQYLLTDYMHDALDLNKIRYSSPLRDALEVRDFESMQRILTALYASVVYELHERKIQTLPTQTAKAKTRKAENELLKKEMFYHAIFHVAMNATGFRTESEILTNLGRIDMAVETDETLYVFEFKVDETADIALDQIMNKQYIQKYEASEYEIYAVGVNFDSKERNVTEIKTKKLK